MSRPKRNILPGCSYHWLTESTHERVVFKDDEDVRVYKDLLLSSAVIGLVEIDNFSLKETSVQISLTAKSNEITTFTKRLQGTYAKYFCRKYGFRGQVWRVHPKCILISEGQQTGDASGTIGKKSLYLHRRDRPKHPSPVAGLLDILMSRNALYQLDAIDRFFTSDPPD
jgi:hypothetical protein